MRFRRCLALLVTCLAIGVGPADAQVSVGNTITSFISGTRPFQDTIVLNGALGPVLVMSEVTRVMNPGEKDEDGQRSDDILVSPKRFSVPARGQRTARLLLKRPQDDEERVYRLVFAPAENAPGAEEYEVSKSGRSAKISVLTTVGMLIFVEPKVIRHDFKWAREGGKLVFTNHGNLHVRLSHIKVCPSAESKPETCKEVEGKRVYPGKRFEVNAGSTETVIFSKKSGDEGPEDEVKFPPQ